MAADDLPLAGSGRWPEDYAGGGVLTKWNGGEGSSAGLDPDARDCLFSTPGRGGKEGGRSYREGGDRAGVSFDITSVCRGGPDAKTGAGRG